MINVKDFAFVPQYINGGTYPQTSPFQEDATIFYVSQWHVDQTHLPYWGDKTHSPYVGPDQRDASFVPYATTDIGLPDWGICNQTDPSGNNNIWDTSYRTCCNGNSWAGIALSVLMMNDTSSTKALWNNNAFFDHQDRFMAMQTKNDWQRTMTRFPADVWDRFRTDYRTNESGYCYTGLDTTTNPPTRKYGDCAVAGVVK